MLGLDFDNLNLEKLTAFIGLQVPEGLLIDYKRELNFTTPADKKEFLKDVCSFANASGGYLVIGVDEDHGLPTDLLGFNVTNLDQFKTSLEQSMRTGIEPEIIGISIKSVTLTDGNTAMVISIPKSMMAPHRVSFQGENKFWSRHNTGKYELGLTELKNIVLESSKIFEQFRSFKKERLTQLKGINFNLRLNAGPKTVLFIAPFVSFNDFRINLNTIRTTDIPAFLSSNPVGYNRRFNFDGHLFANESEGIINLYSLFHRNGFYEGCDSYSISPEGNHRNLYPFSFENTVIAAIKEYVRATANQGITFPFLVSLNILGINGYSVFRPGRVLNARMTPIDRTDLFCEDLVLFSELDLEKKLRPIFDSIWQASGFPHSFGYSDNGNWVGYQE